MRCASSSIPGLAFGTGTHPTTALCLEWLESNSLAGRVLVDYGCGSGILAIAALKLGARRVLAIDIDPQALLATREQRRAKRGERSSDVRCTTQPGTADVLVANILAGPLVDLAASLQGLMLPRSELALSGILLDQVDTVTAAYRPWFDIGLTGSRDGWALLSGRRTV